MFVQNFTAIHSIVFEIFPKTEGRAIPKITALAWIKKHELSGVLKEEKGKTGGYKEIDRVRRHSYT